MAGKRLELGPTGEAVAHNIATARKWQNLTWTDVSRRLEERGRRIPPLGIRRIEEGERRVDADDLVAIAAALEVSPATLLMPPTSTPDTKAVASGIEPTDALELWRWITATAGRPPGSAVEVDLEWMHRARPAWTFRQLSDDELLEQHNARHHAERERKARARGND